MNDEKLAEVIQGLSENNLQQAKLLDRFSNWVLELQKQVNVLDVKISEDKERIISLGVGIGDLQKQVNELEVDIKLLYNKVNFIGEIICIKKGLKEGVVYDVKLDKKGNFNILGFGLAEENLQEVKDE